MQLCRGSLTSLQRRTVQRMGSVLFLTVLTNLTDPKFPNPLFDLVPGLKHFVSRAQFSPAFPFVFESLSLLPVLLAVWIAATYLKRESDEFVKTLVTGALLWGFAVTMAGDAILGVLANLYPRPFPISLLNADLFLASTAVAFRLLRRGYQ